MFIYSLTVFSAGGVRVNFWCSGLVSSVLIGQVGCERGPCSVCSVWAGPGLISGVLIVQVSVGKVRACLEHDDWTDGSGLVYSFLIRQVSVGGVRASL